MNVAQLSHEHMINVFEDDGDKRLMSENDGESGNRTADMLKKGSSSKQVPSLKGLDAVRCAASSWPPDFVRTAG